MSPILVRPVREQLEHDRVIRLLQVKLKRKHEVIANIGEDQSTSVKIGQLQIYPDLVLTSTDRGHKMMGTVEVETSESVNHLEARAQWAHLGRARAPFHLYVPAGSVDIARRLATENQVNVSEIWSFHTIGDQTHFRSCIARRRQGAIERPRGIVTSRVDVPVRPPARAAARCSRTARRSRPAKAVAAAPRTGASKKPAARPAGEEARRGAGPGAQGERRILIAQRRRAASPLRHGRRKGSRSCRTSASIATSRATRTRSSSKAIAAAAGRGRASSTGFARRPG